MHLTATKVAQQMIDLGEAVRLVAAVAEVHRA
jgi:hypothetical protein